MQTGPATLLAYLTRRANRVLDKHGITDAAERKRVANRLRAKVEEEGVVGFETDAAFENLVLTLAEEVLIRTFIRLAAEGTTPLVTNLERTDTKVRFSPVLSNNAQKYSARQIQAPRYDPQVLAANRINRINDILSILPMTSEEFLDLLLDLENRPEPWKQTRKGKHTGRKPEYTWADKKRIFHLWCAGFPEAEIARLSPEELPSLIAKYVSATEISPSLITEYRLAVQTELISLALRRAASAAAVAVIAVILLPAKIAMALTRHFTRTIREPEGIGLGGWSLGWLIMALITALCFLLVPKCSTSGTQGDIAKTHVDTPGQYEEYEALDSTRGASKPLSSPLAPSPDSKADVEVRGIVVVRLEADGSTRQVLFEGARKKGCIVVTKGSWPLEAISSRGDLKGAPIIEPHEPGRKDIGILLDILNSSYTEDGKNCSYRTFNTAEQSLRVFTLTRPSIVGHRQDGFMYGPANGSGKPAMISLLFAQTVPSAKSISDLQLFQPFEDSDSDGLPDFVENQIGTKNTTSDSDGDTIQDFAELESMRLNPTLADTDGDELNDADEAEHGKNPSFADLFEDYPQDETKNCPEFLAVYQFWHPAWKRSQISYRRLDRMRQQGGQANLVFQGVLFFSLRKRTPSSWPFVCSDTHNLCQAYDKAPEAWGYPALENHQAEVLGFISPPLFGSKSNRSGPVGRIQYPTLEQLKAMFARARENQKIILARFRGVGGIESEFVMLESMERYNAELGRGRELADIFGFVFAPHCP